jgi:hypothetical protein
VISVVPYLTVSSIICSDDPFDCTFESEHVESDAHNHLTHKWICLAKPAKEWPISVDVEIEGDFFL